MRSRSAAAALFAGAVLFAALAVWTTYARSAIPLRWDGTVTSVEARREKHPGVDDAWFVAVDGHAVHVDRALAEGLRVGDRVRKAAWERTVRVNGEPRRLRPSRDATRMLVVAPALVVAVAAVARPPRRRDG